MSSNCYNRSFKRKVTLLCQWVIIIYNVLLLTVGTALLLTCCAVLWQSFYSFGACTSSHDVVDYYEHVSFDIIRSIQDINTQYNINDTIS